MKQSPPRLSLYRLKKYSSQQASYLPCCYMIFLNDERTCISNEIEHRALYAANVTIANTTGLTHLLKHVHNFFTFVAVGSHSFITVALLCVAHKAHPVSEDGEKSNGGVYKIYRNRACWSRLKSQILYIRSFYCETSLFRRHWGWCPFALTSFVRWCSSGLQTVNSSHSLRLTPMDECCGGWVGKGAGFSYFVHISRETGVQCLPPHTPAAHFHCGVPKAALPRPGAFDSRCSINQSIKTRDAQASLGYPDRCLHCDGSPSTPVLCNPVWSSAAYHSDRCGRTMITCDVWRFTAEAPGVRLGYWPAAKRIRSFYALYDMPSILL